MTLPRVKGSVLIQMGDRSLCVSNNMVLNGMHWLINRMLPGGPANLSHIAVGDGTAIIQPGDTTLANERARKPIVTQVRDGETLLAETFFDRGEANFQWREVGLFSGGTDTLGTGVLIARALLDESKDDLRTATVTWQIEVS